MRKIQNEQGLGARHHSQLIPGEIRKEGSCCKGVGLGGRQLCALTPGWLALLLLPLASSAVGSQAAAVVVQLVKRMPGEWETAPSTQPFPEKRGGPASGVPDEWPAQMSVSSCA